MNEVCKYCGEPFSDEKFRLTLCLHHIDGNHDTEETKRKISESMKKTFVILRRGEVKMKYKHDDLLGEISPIVFCSACGENIIREEIGDHYRTKRHIVNRQNETELPLLTVKEICECYDASIKED